MANSAGENLVQRKNKRTHLTPTGLLMEGDCTTLRFLFAKNRDDECYGDVTPTILVKCGYHADEVPKMSWNTLPPDAYRPWEERLAIRYSGDGYAVDFLSHSAVKYLEGGRSITFSSEPVARTVSDGKTRWGLTVYIHRPMRWDDSNGTEINDADEEQAILSRLETALKAKIGDYELARDAG